MVAIGDAEGTISVMSLCKPLHDTTSKEKETMHNIFEREFRREKNLEIQKKKEMENKAPPKKKVDEGALLKEKADKAE